MGFIGLEGLSAGEERPLMISRLPKWENISVGDGSFRRFLANPVFRSSQMNFPAEVHEIPRLPYNNEFSYNALPAQALASVTLSSPQHAGSIKPLIPANVPVNLYIVGRNSTGHYLLGDILALRPGTEHEGRKIHFPTVLAPVPIALTDIVSYTRLNEEESLRAIQNPPFNREEYIDHLLRVA